MAAIFQARVTSVTGGCAVSSEWNERTFYDAETVEDIAAWVRNEEDCGCITEEIEAYIGEQDYEYGIELVSCVNNVLRIDYRYTYFNEQAEQWMPKNGYLTIME